MAPIHVRLSSPSHSASALPSPFFTSETSFNILLALFIFLVYALYAAQIVTNVVRSKKKTPAITTVPTITITEAVQEAESAFLSGDEEDDEDELVAARRARDSSAVSTEAPTGTRRGLGVWAGMGGEGPSTWSRRQWKERGLGPWS